uniref:Mif2/CENP-C cupin domain-containing protein n=1 Tax=Knipowitschia caucasica TaxID=637954 RepID=A0AAV2L3N6_KNICA
MDDYFPTLKRPKKKLVFPTTNSSVPCQWAEGDLENVDKMFEDLDSKIEDFPSPSPEINIPKHVEGDMDGDGDKEGKPYPSVSPELAIDSETPFKRHGPVKTSSPIEQNVIQHKNKQKKNEDNSASPILFDCEENNQDLEIVGQTSEKRRYIRKDESDDSMFETLPKTFVINKMSTQKKPARSKPSTPSCPPLSPERFEATPAAPEKPAESVPTREKMTAFLQKLRDAGQPKPASTGLLQAKVQPQVTESEPEDDFLILEDDAPLQKKSKPLKGNDGDCLKKTPVKADRKQADVLEERSPAPDCESPIPGVNNLKASSMEGSSIEESSGVLVKRKRKRTGQWWLVSPQSPQQQPTDKQPAVKKRKERIKKVIPSSSSDDAQKPKAERKNNKQRTLRKARTVRRIMSEDSEKDFQESSQDKALDQDFDSSPLVFAPKEPGTSSEHLFSKVYKKQNTPRGKLASPTRPDEQFGSKGTTHRARKSHTHQRQVTSTPEDKQGELLQPQKRQSEKGKTLSETKKRRKPVRCPSKPPGGAVEQSVASHGGLYGTINVEPPLNKKKNTKRLTKQNNINPPAAEDAEADHNVVCMEVEEANRNPGISTIIRSGPPSMIGLGNYEEDEDIELPSSLVQPALCASDLCAPPLRPLVLQPKDRVNLQEWLKCLWPATDRGCEITPDHFEWYGYQGRAFGLTVDIQTSSICNGKMLLGSFMKKPLWVDHSARTVFNLLTSSVSLIVDRNKSCYSAGQSFMVPPGQAYSIHNLCAQPAVLYFTRVYEEESDTQDINM